MVCLELEINLPEPEQEEVSEEYQWNAESVVVSPSVEYFIHRWKDESDGYVWQVSSPFFSKIIILSSIPVEYVP